MHKRDCWNFNTTISPVSTGCLVALISVALVVVATGGENGWVGLLGFISMFVLMHCVRTHFTIDFDDKTVKLKQRTVLGRKKRHVRRMPFQIKHVVTYVKSVDAISAVEIVFEDNTVWKLPDGIHEHLPTLVTNLERITGTKINVVER
jgi:hypothetical protein